MEELLYFILGLIAEALGLKAKKPAVPPAPLSPVPPRRPMPAPGNTTAAPNVAGAGTRPDTLVRRPDAGGPAVPRDATAARFDAQERDLLLTRQPEPDASMPRSSTPMPPDITPTLFAGTDDFVRAFILQEALGPPLCRRAFRP